MAPFAEAVEPGPPEHPDGGAQHCKPSPLPRMPPDLPRPIPHTITLPDFVGV